MKVSDWLDEAASEAGLSAAVAIFDPLHADVAELFSGDAHIYSERKFASTSSNRMLAYLSDKPLADILTFEYNWSNLENINLDKNFDGKPDATVHLDAANGFVTGANVDYDQDGQADVQFTISRGETNFVIGVDTNNDGKLDHKLTSIGDGSNGIAGLRVDLGNDGTADGFLMFEKSPLGLINGMDLRRNAYKLTPEKPHKPGGEGHW